MIFFRTFLVIIALFFSLSLKSQESINIESVFLSMPSEMLPYLDKTMKEVLLHSSSVRNKLNKECKIVKKTDKMLDIHLTDVTRLQLVIDNNKIYSFITNNGHEGETLVRRYSKDWKMDGVGKIPYTSINFLNDTISSQRRDEVLNYVDLEMINAFYDSDEHVVKYSVSTLMLSSDEKQKIADCLVEINVNLADIKFN